MPTSLLRLLAVLLTVGVTAAACSGQDVDEPAADLVTIGTEAWMGTEPPLDPGATALPAVPAVPDSGQDPSAADAEDPTDQTTLGEDPTADNGSGGVGSVGQLPSEPTAAPVQAVGEIGAIVAAMTVEQKVGQLFVVSVIGDDATSPSPSAQRANTALYGVATPADVVQRYHLGGVAYFDHDQGPGTSNVADLTRTAALSTGIQAAAAQSSGIGLLIGADQEGGPVVRLGPPATVFPAARDVAGTGDVDLAQQVGAVTGQEALAVGVNWVYAPVADVNVNPANPVIGDRAFGTTPVETMPYVQATAAGLAGAGVLPTLKHFPGHGDTSIDSHNSLPTIDHDLATLDSVDFPPFTVAQQVSPISVMVGHLAVPAIDPSGVPATISPPIISVLRENLGFTGLVVTDAMNMGALQGFGDSGTLAVDAINAGIDMVLLPIDLPLAWNAVRDAVLDGRISTTRLDAAVGNVLRAKAAIGALDAESVQPVAPQTLGSPDAVAVRETLRQACDC